MIVRKRSQEEGVHIGDVVTLQNRTELMTVEAVRLDTFGPVVDCIWFDHDDGLRFRRFPLNAVDLYPRTPEILTIKTGTEVRLRSRGPVMTVTRILERDGLNLGECVWTGATGRERKRAFSLDCLVLTMLEQFEDEDGLTF